MFTNTKSLRLVFRLSFTILGGLLILVEALSYLVLFHHLWTHDNKVPASKNVFFVTDSAGNKL
jgi:hypothetical protein